MTTETKPAKAPSLHRKLAQVMYEAERIPKNGTAPAAMGGYKFVQVGDAADYIRKALAELGVTMMPTAIQPLSETEHATAKGGTMTTYTVRMDWTITDGDSGESILIQSIGTGSDSGDKFASKATTSAMKYALLSGFLLSTGDDIEQSDTSDRQSKEAPGDETLEMLGNLQKTGTITKGGADKYQSEWHEQPDGHAIGFRLKIDGEDRDIPQVLVMGHIGEALYLATAGDGSTLLKQKVTVKGKLWNIRQPGRTSYYRLIIGAGEADFILTPEVRIPALDVPVEATPEPLFPDEAEQAAILEAELAEAAR